MPNCTPADDPANGGARFAADAATGRWTFAGALTFANAADVCAAAARLPLPASGVVDCAGIRAVDSAAVAVLLLLQRRAAGEGRSLTFASLPESLAALGELYGVADILATRPSA
jgi:phospholipid transport system transporter-binding protein